MSGIIRVLSALALAAILLTAVPTWAADGQQLFNETCANCHGKNGDGKTNYGKKIPTPDLRSKEVQSKPDEDLYATIARGVGHVNYPHGYEMRGMSKDKIFSVIQYIRTMAK